MTHPKPIALSAACDASVHDEALKRVLCDHLARAHDAPPQKPDFSMAALPSEADEALVQRLLAEPVPGATSARSAAPRPTPWSRVGRWLRSALVAPPGAGGLRLAALAGLVVSVGLLINGQLGGVGGSPNAAAPTPTAQATAGVSPSGGDSAAPAMADDLATELAELDAASLIFFDLL